MRKSLTATVVERMRPPDKGRLTLSDAIVPGLQFRISDRGVKTFSVVYRVRGGDRKLKRYTIGRYSRDDLDLGEARRRARAARELADQGIDYEVVSHRHTLSSSQTAQACHVSGDCLAKAVVVKDE